MSKKTPVEEYEKDVESFREDGRYDDEQPKKKKAAAQFEDDDWDDEPKKKKSKKKVNVWDEDEPVKKKSSKKREDLWNDWDEDEPKKKKASFDETQDWEIEKAKKKKKSSMDETQDWKIEKAKKKKKSSMDETQDWEIEEPKKKKKSSVDETQDWEIEEPKKKKGSAAKKKSHGALSFVIVMLVFAAIAFGVWKYREPLQKYWNEIRMGPTEPAAETTPAPHTGSAFADKLNSVESSDETLTGGNSIQVSDLSIHEGLDEKWLNVLLLGTDTRVTYEAARTDTMMICSINKQTGNVKLASIMRDTAVSFQSHSNVRINSAFFYGGERLAMKTINEYFGMNIQNYVYVDFNGFAAIAEVLGGVDMDISASEMEQININVVEQYYIAYKQGKISYEDAEREYYATELKEAGTSVHLNGMQTLGYARIRKTDNDYTRAERQRKVLNLLMTNLKSASESKLITLFSQCKDYFRTNLSLSDIISVASLVLNRTDFQQAQEMRLPVAGTYKEERRNDEAMLYDMDVSANQRELFNFIYPTP